MSERVRRVNELMRQILGEALGEMTDPGLGFVTITSVDCSRDFEHAIVYVSVLGNDVKRKRSMQALERATGHLQARVGREVTLRRTPRLRFAYDETFDKGRRIEQLLAEHEPMPELRARARRRPRPASARTTREPSRGARRAARHGPAVRLRARLARRRRARLAARPRALAGRDRPRRRALPGRRRAVPARARVPRARAHPAPRARRCGAAHADRARLRLGAAHRPPRRGRRAVRARRQHRPPPRQHALRRPSTSSTPRRPAPPRSSPGCSTRPASRSPRARRSRSTSAS